MGFRAARVLGGRRRLGLGASLLPALCGALRKENSGVRRGPSSGNIGLITFGVFSLRTSLVLVATSLRLLLKLGFFKASAFDGGQGAGCRWPPALLQGGLAGRGVCWGGGGEGGIRARLREDSLSPPGRANVGAGGTRGRSSAGQHPGLGKVEVGRSELGDESGDLKRGAFLSTLSGN